jgi:hypothetical protein
MLEQQKEQVKEVDVDIDAWLGTPGAESIVTPQETKPNVFTNKEVDLSFIDVEDKPEEKVEEKVNIDEVIQEIDKPAEVEEPKPGRPKTEKSSIVEFFKKRIEAQEMFAFDDYDETKQTIDEYLSGLTEKDYEDLWSANVTNLKEQVASATPKDFFESLPQELQYAAQYVADGGEDLKGLFQALAQVHEVKELDTENEYDQETIVKQYLSATNFGTPEEIEDELKTWKDLGHLGKKAKQFKPKLDQMHEEMVQGQLREQEHIKAQQQKAQEQYVNNVFEALRTGELNSGLKLDKSTQAKLYSGLVQTPYQSISGRPTNLFGHLIEKHQFIEPNYPLIAEALWLLSDPEAYRSELKKQGKNEAVANTVRQLKTEQSKKVAGTVEQEEKKSYKLPKVNNIFKR